MGIWDSFSKFPTPSLCGGGRVLETERSVDETGVARPSWEVARIEYWGVAGIVDN